eukprot:scaffold3533_cov137-Skeletonema_menzelii.AAC.2
MLVGAWMILANETRNDVRTQIGTYSLRMCWALVDAINGSLTVGLLYFEPIKKESLQSVSCYLLLWCCAAPSSFEGVASSMKMKLTPCLPPKSLCTKSKPRAGTNAMPCHHEHGAYW